MKRWIKAALITLCLIVLTFFASYACLPVKTTKGNTTPVAEVSVVSITKHKNHTKQQVYKQNKDFRKHKESLQDSLFKEKKEDIKSEEVQPQKENEDFQDNSNDTNNDTETNNEIEQFNKENYGTVSGKKVDSYKSYVLGRIASKKVYPLASRSTGQEGRVKIKLILNQDGTILFSEIVRPSRYPLLNEASLEAIKKAEPFKKMPDGMKSLELVFSIDYTLQ